MESLNQMPSFGDNTLSACMQAEVKNMEIYRDDTNMDKYFKDTTLRSKMTNEPANVNGAAVLGNIDESNVPVNAQNGLCRDISESRERRQNVRTSQEKKKENIKPVSGRSKVKSKVCSKRHQGPYTIGKEHVNTNRGKTESQLSSTRLLRGTDKSDLLTVATEDSRAKSNIGHDVTESDRDVQLSISNAMNNGERSTEITSSICTIGTQDRCKLSSWGLPPNILRKYEARKVLDMFPWQVECLSNRKVIEEKRNLVYSAPTSAGKTLVAEILMIKTVLERQKKVIFILPFVSVVREKMYYFQDLLSDSGVRVEGFMGGIVPAGGFAATHIAIATIEKANSLVNHLMEENELVNLGAVVIDELHLVGDPNRGYLLELLLTKLKYMALRDENIRIQLIGMSATLPNLSLLAEWLDAELYKTEFRPVPLNEQCKIGTDLYDNKLCLIRSLIPIPELAMDTEHILQLCVETISDGHSVLIFCPTKNWCEKLAEQISAAFFKLGQENMPVGMMLREQLDSTLISETLEQLKRSPPGLDNVLKNTVSFGVAFHHAGLTMDERDIIEGSFRIGSLRVLIATSTLSSGVNLPARRVIIRSPMFGGKLLDGLTYKQMIGRAGRMGKDSAGESILVCKANERKAAESLLSANLKPIESCLVDAAPLIRALLEAIASEVVFTPQDLELYTKCTLVNFAQEGNTTNPSKEAIKFLIDNEFILLQKTDEEHRWVATALGKACLAASVPPREGLFLLEELQKARRCFVLDTELHVIYLVTPLSSGTQISTIDWMTFFELWKDLSESERRVGELVGVEERFMMSAIRGTVRPGKYLNIHKRFYTALALYDLVRETPLNKVCKKYGCCRGVLQSLQQSASTFAGMVTQFCKQLGWDCMELLVSQFQTRLQFGVCRELLDLLRLPMLNGLRARSLYKQGITCVADLAIANELDVERALHKALPFESEKEHDGEHKLDAIERNKMRTVFVTGRDGLTAREAAGMLVQEARALVQNELKLQDMSWKQNDQSVVKNGSCIESKSEIQQDAIQSIQPIDTKTDEISVHNNLQIVFEQDNNADQDMHNAMNKSTKSIDQEKNSLNDRLSENAECKFGISSMNSFKDLAFHTVDNIVIETNNDNINPTEQVLQLDIPESSSLSNEKYSLDVFDDSSPKILDNSGGKRNSQSLISFKSVKRNKTQNVTYNPLRDNSQDAENSDNTSSKKLRTSGRTEHLNLAPLNVIVPKSDIVKDLQPEASRSPSLFDDSLNLDTQMCNVLEQNIDSLHFSDFEDTKLGEIKSGTTSIPKKMSALSQDNNKEAQVGDSLKGKLETKGPPNSTHVQSTYSSLSWKDDSWNESNRIMEELGRIKEKNNEQIPNKQNIRNIKNTNISYTLETAGTSNSTPETRRKHEIKTEKSVYNSEHFKKIVPKRRSKEMPADQSPIAKVIVFSKNRAISVDSNKSDSDDVVVASQNLDSPAASTKMRSRLESARKQKMCAQKLPTSTTSERAESVSRKIKPKLNEILAKNTFICKDYSMDSVISNSDEDTPVKSINTLQKCKISLKKIEVKPEMHNVLDNINESINWNTLNIIKVGSDRGTFNLFKRELMRKRYIALALSCETYSNEVNIIGSRVLNSANTERTARSKKVENYVHGDKKICGAAISWENNIAYYISFSSVQESKISGKEQMKLLKELLSNSSLYVKCFATKEVFRTLYECCGITASCKFLDPKVASWLHDGDACDKTFNEMVKDHFPQGCFITKRIGSCYDTGPGLNTKNTLPGEFRASAESVLTWHITDALLDKLEKLCPTLLYTFKDIEMRVITILACMELTGLGVCLKSLQEMSSIIRKEMASLEERAYSLSGKKFNFSSSREVSKILGLCSGKKVSVNKAVLGQSDHPISNLVISWRKLSCTQSKMVFPLLNLAQHGPRIHGNCVTNTLTGRISMHEPNLQNVPKNFNSDGSNFVISIRMAFVPAVGNIMLAADYCQLELRILAHFSQDATLCDIMRKPGDIFRNIAAKWNHVSEYDVDDGMRQRTKQLCYGMIYGMGIKTLAETLSVDETKAKEFQESFMNTYPKIREWLDNVVKEARVKGYITTLLERRRTLPGLTSTKPSEKSQAERQAVNTKVQGSAADIAKKAMVNIEDRTRFEFPNSASIIPAVHNKRKLRSNSREAQQRGGYLILQIHDELLYEVNMNDLRQFATIVKESMEQVCQLAVPLPVKIKVGPAWGDLSEYNF